MAPPAMSWLPRKWHYAWVIVGVCFAVAVMTAAANAAGQLVFLPTMASLVTHLGWRIMSVVLAGAVVVFLPIPALLMRDRPGDVGLRPYGDLGASRLDASPKGNPVMVAFRALAMGARSRDFWLIAGGYLVCGATTNGLIGTHLIAACVDHGLSEVAGAGLLAATGIFALLGGTSRVGSATGGTTGFCCALTMGFAASRCCICRSRSICRSTVCRYLVSYMASIGLPVRPLPCACSPALSAPRGSGSWWRGSPSSIRSAAPRRHTWLGSCVSRSAPIWKPSSSQVSC